MIDKEKLKMLRISPNLLNDFGVLMAEEQKEHDNVHLDMLRHSTSHVMAQAVRDLFPDAKVAIGPSIENGFYYDFDYEPGFTEEDLSKIENRMKELVKMDLPIAVSYTHLRAHETPEHIVCRLLLEKNKTITHLV